MALDRPGLAKYNSFSRIRVGCFTCGNRVNVAARSVSNFNPRDGFIKEPF